MRKAIALSVATLTLALVASLAPSLSSGAVGDTNGPACRDITNGQFNYTGTGINGDQPPYNLNAQLLLGPAGDTAPCKQLTYTLYVIVDGADPANAQAYPLDGSAQWLNIATGDDDPNICVFATTSHNGKVYDTAPDTGCLVLTAGTTGGGTGFN